MSFVSFVDGEGEFAVGRVVSKDGASFLVERLPFVDDDYQASFWARAPYLFGLRGVCLVDNQKDEVVLESNVVEFVCVFKRTAFYPPSTLLQRYLFDKLWYHSF